MRGAFDVGRERGFADFFQRVENIFRTGEAHVALAGGVFFEHDGGVCGGVAVRVGELNFGAGAHAFARAEQCPPIVRRVFFDEEHFDLAAAAGFFSPQARGDDARVVEDDGVAGRDEFEQVGEAAMFPPGVAAMDDEEARGVAFGGGLLGDQFRRQRVVEVGGAQIFSGLVHVPASVAGDREGASLR